MAQDNDVYVGDVGTIISLETGLSVALLATVTLAQIRVQKKNKVEVVWVGSVVGTAVEYTIAVDDLDVGGSYKMQNYLEMPTWTGSGRTVSMKVLDKYK